MTFLSVVPMRDDTRSVCSLSATIMRDDIGFTVHYTMPAPIFQGLFQSGRSALCILRESFFRRARKGVSDAAFSGFSSGFCGGFPAFRPDFSSEERANVKFCFQKFGFYRQGNGELLQRSAETAVAFRIFHQSSGSRHAGGRDRKEFLAFLKDPDQLFRFVLKYPERMARDSSASTPPITSGL